MPTEVAMPRLGWDMQVGSIAEWVKQDGDPVEEGDVICMITGDKATTELEAPGRGILRISSSSPAAGVEVPVGTLLAYLVEPGEDVPSDTVAVSGSQSATANPDAAVSGPNVSGSGSGAIASKLAALGSDFVVSLPSLADVAAEGRSGRTGRVVASPRARRVAAGLGLDWRTLVGSGRGGRILERDVAQASATRPQPATRLQPATPPRPSAPQPAAAGSDDAADGPQALPGGLTPVVNEPLPLGGIRRSTAERMSLSSRTVAPVTLGTEANATTLVRLREQALAERGASDGVPGVTDLLVKIVALALTEHPALNAELTERGIVQHADVHIAIAVDTEQGLLAPVIHNADSRSVESIARESARLIADARSHTTRQADLAGATFTISNLGMYEIDAFTPIVNLPQCAILGIGRILAKPVVVDEATDQVAVQRMLSLSLTFDHRLVDGAPAARFLQRIKHLVERPTLWLFR